MVISAMSMLVSSANRMALKSFANIHHDFFTKSVEPANGSVSRRSRSLDHRSQSTGVINDGRICHPSSSFFIQFGSRTEILDPFECATTIPMTTLL